MANVIREPLQRKVVAYPAKSLALALQGAADRQVAVYSASARNSSGGSINVGIFKSLNAYSRAVYKFVAIGSVLTSIGDTLDAGTAVQVFEANNDYIAFGSKVPSGMVSVNISVAAGVNGVYAVQYWNGAWTTLNTYLAEAYTSTGNRLFVFPAPVDWVAGGITGADSSMYYFRYISTTAPDDGGGPPLPAPASVDRVLVCEMLDFQEAIADGGGIEVVALDSHKPLILDQGEGLLPYFGTVNNLNTFSASYNVAG